MIPEFGPLWLPVAIPGLGEYFGVSEHGRVWSVPRVVENRGSGARYLVGNRLLTPNRSTGGYHRVTLTVDGKSIRPYVHELVLTAHVGPRPPGMQACHGPAGIDDNSVGNLRWDTVGANIADQVRDGTHPYASRTACPLDHVLAAPNLEPSELRRGHRKCYACSLAGSIVRGRRRRGTEVPDLRMLADEKYAEIMGGTGG